MRRILMLLLFFACLSDGYQADAQELAIDAPADLIAPGTVVQVLSDDFQFTEGPTASSDGVVYFTDQPNNRIMRVAPDGQIETFMQPAGRANGMDFTPEGRLIACADEHNELWSIDVQTKEKETLITAAGGERLNGPNDVWVDLNGLMFFTDPYYQRPWWQHKQPPRSVRGLYRLKSAGEVVLLDGDFQQPNGIVGDGQRRLLFVADIEAKKIYRYRLDAAGDVSDRQLFCEHPSDGLTLDSAGNLYITNSNGVTIFDSDGQQIGRIATGANWTANVCFGGPEFDTLYITASKRLLTVKTLMHGLR